MKRKIKNTDDLMKFAKQLIKEGVNFHCDTDFNDYINIETSQQTYTKQQASFRNYLMNQCFAICEKNRLDIYEIMNEAFLKETGLDKVQNGT